MPTPLPENFFDCLVMNTVKTARTLSRRYDAVLRPHGVTVVQFSLLAILRAYPGKPLSTLATVAAMDRTTLSRNLDLLEKKGLVQRMPGAGNARLCQLSSRGEALLEGLIPTWRAAQAEIKGLIGGTHDPAAFLDVLQILERG